MRAKTVRRFGLTLMLAVVLLAASLLLLYVPHVKAGPQGVTRTYPGAAPCNTSLQACIDGSADGDVINIASAIKLPDFAQYFQLPISSNVSKVMPIEESENAYYIRLETRDSPGVIGHLGLAFGNHGVSLHSFTQRGVTEDGTATIVLLTHQVKEKQLQAALKEIIAHPTTKQIGVLLRVLS